MKKALDVTILGQKFTISSDADESYMLKVADYVDNKMQELMQSPKPSVKSNVAMLAALNIADELFRIREATRARDSQIAERASELEQLLDRVLMAS